MEPQSSGLARDAAEERSAIPYLRLTTTNWSPENELGTDGVQRVQQNLLRHDPRQVILPLVAGEESDLLQNFIAGLLCLPGCESVLLSSRPVPSLALAAAAAANAATSAAASGAAAAAEEEAAGDGGGDDSARAAGEREKGSSAADDAGSTLEERLRLQSRGLRVALPGQGSGGSNPTEETDPALDPEDRMCLALVGGVRCQWGRRAVTHAATTYEQYVRQQMELMAAGGDGPRAPGAPALVTAEQMDLAEEKETIYGQTSVDELRYRPAPVPPPVLESPVASASAASLTTPLPGAEERRAAVSFSSTEGSIGETSDDGRKATNANHNASDDALPPSPAAPPAPRPSDHAIHGGHRGGDGGDDGGAGHGARQRPEDQYACWASNHVGQMPTLPLDAVSAEVLPELAAHMARSSLRGPNEATAGALLHCLGNPHDLQLLPEEERAFRVRRATELLTAASFMQL